MRFHSRRFTKFCKTTQKVHKWVEIDADYWWDIHAAWWRLVFVGK